MFIVTEYAALNIDDLCQPPVSWDLGGVDFMKYALSVIF